MPTIHPERNVSGRSFAIVVSRFNELVTARLQEAAVRTLVAHGASDDDILTVHVPGSFEIPVAADQLAKSGKYAGVICLGAVIQGQTTHHEYINSSVASAIMNSSLKTGVPIGFGVLTCENLEQAQNRSGGKFGNKGEEATSAVIEMVSILEQIGSASAS